MSVLKRGREKKVEATKFQESTSSTINDIPPEVLEMILMNLDCGKNSMLPYRVVSSTWKSIIDDHLEKKSLKGELVACSKAFCMDGGLRANPLPRIRVPPAILHHPWNPFPSRSLLVTQKDSYHRGRNDKTIYIIPLATFTAKFGSLLTTFVIERVQVNFSTLVQILTPMSNLRILRLSKIFVELFLDDDLDTFPILPKLTTLDQTWLFLDENGAGLERVDQFFAKLIEKYASHLVTLRFESIGNYIPFQKSQPAVENRHFEKLEHLGIHNPTLGFLRLRFVPPLKRLSIVHVDYSLMQMDPNVKIDVIMSFVNKFCNTLESLDLNIPWNYAFSFSREQRNIQLHGIFKTKSVIFPKLANFAVAYPTHSFEAAIIKNLFLVKFPVLGGLQFFHFKLAREIDLLTEKKRYESCRKTDNDIIKEFLLRENYSEKCTKLNRISVWFSAEEKDNVLRDDNYLVYSTRVQVGE